MTTIDNIMKLADAYKDAAESQTYMDQSGSMYQWKVAKEKAEESREALRAALTEALAAQPVREPLSDEQIRNLSDLPECMNGDYLQAYPFARAIERAHGIG